MYGKNIMSKPFDLLNDALGKEILVVLKGNVQVRGTLRAFDIHMNLNLENANELVNGEMKTNYGKVLLRGDSVILVSP